MAPDAPRFNNRQDYPVLDKGKMCAPGRFKTSLLYKHFLSLLERVYSLGALASRKEPSAFRAGSDKPLVLHELNPDLCGRERKGSTLDSDSLINRDLVSLKLTFFGLI
jgi:hypothetical protein